MILLGYYVVVFYKNLTKCADYKRDSFNEKILGFSKEDIIIFSNKLCKILLNLYFSNKGNKTENRFSIASLLLNSFLFFTKIFYIY
jgi:hypothetical protein